MIKTYKYKGETWIDIDHGTADEIHKIMYVYNIHPFVAKELTSKTPKPRVEIHEDYIYCILHFPAWKHTHSEDSNQEIDFLISKDALITARYDTIDALHKLGKELEVEEVLQKDEGGVSGQHLILTKMFRELYTSIFEELEVMEDNIQRITSQIFENKERQMVISISEITRTLLEFKRVIDLHEEILETLKHKGREMFGEEFADNIHSVIMDYLKINTMIKADMDMLKELRDTDNSLLAAKQNETIKRLTLVGAVLFIISILVALFR